MAAEKENHVEEMQILEQRLNNILLQKHSFQMEFSETQSALREIENSGDDVFKIVGQLMIKSDKTRIKEELSNKEKITDMRIKSLERQEESMMKELEGLREKVLKSMKNNKK